MLRISKLADYGTIVMVTLARHPNILLSAKEIAAKTHVAQPTVSKLLKLLAKSGLLTSQQGVKGGYGLARSAPEISVAEIIQAVEGGAGLTECSVHQGDCSLEPVCMIRGNWRLISAAVNTALDSVSLAALAKPAMLTMAVNVSEIQGLAGSE